MSVTLVAPLRRVHRGEDHLDGALLAAAHHRQLDSRAALSVVVGKLENRRPLVGDRVLPDLTDLDRGAVRWAVRIGRRYARFVNATVPLSRTCT